MIKAKDQATRQAPPAKSRRLEKLEPLKAVGGVPPILNADLRGQKPMKVAEGIRVRQRFCQRKTAFQNPELSNSICPWAEPEVCQ
jgi:hypothetical protein